MTEPPDGSDLLQRLRQGQEEAAAELYRLYAERIRALIRSRCSAFLASRLDPDDVLQSVFRAFFEAARRGVYRAPDADSLWSLLAVIALNKLRTVHAGHLAARRDVRATEPLPPDGVVDSLLAPQLIEVEVRDVLEQLPPAVQAVARLRLNGYEVTEIAQRLQLSKRSVERLLQRCREHLNVLLDLGEKANA
jgi:RNA polymerase sigma-70 factor (ECF subfamily)